MYAVEGPSDRERLHRAALAEVFRDGLHRATVGDVVRVAGVSRERFYDLFPSLQACYSDALEPLRVAMRQQSKAAAPHLTGSLDAFERQLRAFLLLLAEDPERTWCLLFEHVDASVDPTFSDTGSRRALVAVLDELLDGRGGPAADAAAAMLHQLIEQHVVNGRTAQLPGVARTFTDLLRAQRAGIHQLRRGDEAG